MGFAEWITKRIAPRPVYFMLPSSVAKGPPSLLSAATCAWPLYMSLCTDVVVVQSERWEKSLWTRLDCLMGAIWAKKPLYLLPEKHEPPIELSAGATPTGPSEDDAAKESPLSLRPDEPFTIGRPTEGAVLPPLIADLAARALEAEKALGIAYVARPTLAIKRLG